jgi:hypothetical protein
MYLLHSIHLVDFVRWFDVLNICLFQYNIVCFSIILCLLLDNFACPMFNCSYYHIFNLVHSIIDFSEFQHLKFFHLPNLNLLNWFHSTWTTKDYSQIYISNIRSEIIHKHVRYRWTTKTTTCKYATGKRQTNQKQYFKIGRGWFIENLFDLFRVQVYYSRIQIYLKLN